MDTLSTIILGIVEGLTEFLPVSSTGHLIISSSLLGLTDMRTETFNVVIQAGAILAAVVLYWRKFIGLVRPAEKSTLSGVHGLWLLFLTCLPASVLGLLLHSLIKRLFTPVFVAAALLCGAVLMIAVECWMKKHREGGSAGETARTLMTENTDYEEACRAAGNLAGKLKEMRCGKFEGLVPGTSETPARIANTIGTTTAFISAGTPVDAITARQAFGIGCFQCLALWPGFSRSASTILGGMLLGLSRKSAAEYSFIAAVPIICAAGLYDLLKNLSLFSAADIPSFLIGSAVAFVSAVVAIKSFVALLGRFDLKPFAIYRIIIAIPVYWFMVH